MKVSEIIKTAELPDVGVEEIANALRELSKFEGLRIVENLESVENLSRIKIADLQPIDFLLAKTGKDAEFDALLNDQGLGDLPDDRKQKIKILLWDAYKDGQMNALANFSQFDKTAEDSGMGKLMNKVAEMLELLHEENQKLRRENVELRVSNRISKLAESLVRSGKYGDINEAEIELRQLIQDVVDPDEATRVLEKFAETFKIERDNFF